MSVFVRRCLTRPYESLVHRVIAMHGHLPGSRSGGLMVTVGLDLHKRYITACSLDDAGTVLAEHRRLESSRL